MRFQRSEKNWVKNMNDTNKKLCKEFEYECWLYIERSLSEERKQLWNHHISECDECKELAQKSANTVKNYEQLPLDDMPDLTFTKIINRATKEEKRVVFKPFARKGRSLSEVFGLYKLTFGGAVLLAAMVLIFITFFNDPKLPEIEKQISEEMLRWDYPTITELSEGVENQIISLKTDDWDVYIIKGNKKEVWRSALKSIHKQIRKMKKEALSTSM